MLILHNLLQKKEGIIPSLAQEASITLEEKQMRTENKQNPHSHIPHEWKHHQQSMSKLSPAIPKNSDSRGDLSYDVRLVQYWKINQYKLPCWQLKEEKTQSYQSVEKERVWQSSTSVHDKPKIKDRSRMEENSYILIHVQKPATNVILEGERLGAPSRPDKQTLQHQPGSLNLWLTSSAPLGEDMKLIQTIYESRSVESDSLWPRGLEPARLLCPWTSPGKNTGVGSHSLLQGIFSAQGWNLGLPHCWWILHHLGHQRSSDNLETGVSAQWDPKESTKNKRPIKNGREILHPDTRTKTCN